MGWLKASVELALERPDLASEFRDYLRTLDLSNLTCRESRRTSPACVRRRNAFSERCGVSDGGRTPPRTDRREATE